MARRSHPSLSTETEALRLELQKQRQQSAKLLQRLRRADATLKAARQGRPPDSPAPDRRRPAPRNSERGCRALLDQVSQGAGLVRADGTLALCNAPLAALLGLSPESAEGRSLLERLPGDGREVLRRLLPPESDSGGRGEIALGETGAIRALFALEPLPDGGGPPLFRLVVTDLREQHRCAALEAAEAKARLREQLHRSLLQGLQEGLCLAEVSSPSGEPFDLRCAEVNSAFERMAGMAREELVGRRARELEPALPLGSLEALAEVASTGVPARRAVCFESLGRAFEVFAFRPCEGQVGLLCIEITESVRTADALRESEDRCRAAADELRANRRRQTEFLSVLSHELRNPLAPIRNSLLLLDHAPPGSGQARRAQATLDRQVNQLVRLVDGLLDAARLARNTIRLQRARLSLDEVVRRAAEDHRPLFESAGVRLEIARAPAPVTVDADWARVAQIVGNLLQNAAKFTPRGGSTSISVEREPEERWAVIRVKDTGAGMSAELVEQLFQPFLQADRSLDRTCGGLGLGLAVAKGLVELHGGQVHASSDGPGLGSEIVVRFPLEESEPDAARSPTSPCAQGRSQRVLIIEDNADAADSLREVLELDAHVVEVAYDGLQGIAKARQFKPEVVLCDIGLPGMDGYEVARTFRADEALRGAYLVALSGYALPEDVRRATAAGFRQHLAKPPSLEELEALLGSVARGAVALEPAAPAP